MKLVQFPDGSYGVKRFPSIFGTYLNFEVWLRSSVRLWNNPCDVWFRDCHSTKEAALGFLFGYKGKAIKVFSRKEAKALHQEIQEKYK